VIDALIPPADAGYIAAMAARWRDALAASPEEPEHLVISFHGIPVRYNRREGRVYTDDCAATTAAFLRAIAWPRERATLAFQSKFGPEPWLKPATARVLAELPARGISRVAVITPGFVTEGLETIEEIGIRGRETFEEAGGRALLRVPAVADHPEFIDALARIAVGQHDGRGAMTEL
jgi:ferrochelatase